MKISVNGLPLFEINDTQMKLFAWDIPADILEDDLKRRLQWVIMEKYNHIMPRFKDAWLPALKESGATHIPLNDDEFIEMVCALPQYQSRKQRDS